MHAPVASAVAQVQRAFHEHPVTAIDDGLGGAFVVIESMNLGPAFVPGTSWVGFQIPAMYPRADVYPHFVRPDLARADGGPLTAPLNPGNQMPGFNRPAVMVSRRSNRWDPARDTAALKLQRILTWFWDQGERSRVAA